MDNWNNILRGIWDAPLLSAEALEQARSQVLLAPKAGSDERSTLLACGELMKSGDFSVKPILIKLMNEARDPEVQMASVRVFASVCNHKDLQNADNFSFLEQAEEDLAHTFIADSIFMLSYEVLPYLFMLLDEWDDTNLEDFVRNSLDYITDYSDVMDYYASAEEIHEHVEDLLAQSFAETYYFRTLPFSPAPLAKRITAFAQHSLGNNVPLSLYIQPRMLSIVSGRLCPLGHDDIVNEASMRELFRYIEGLIEFPWVEGAKYYYGHRIV